MRNQEWTIQRHWPHWVHKTQDDDKQTKKQKKQQKTTTQKTITMSSTSPRRSLGFSQQIKLAATKYN